MGVALLFSVYRFFSLSFPTWGNDGFESQSAVILWLEHFLFFLIPPMNIESLVSVGETGKWRRGEREGKNLFGAGMGNTQDTVILHPSIRHVQRVYWH